MPFPACLWRLVPLYAPPGGGGLWPSLKTAENASNGAVQTASGETLTWSDFVNAVKNTGGGVSEEDVKAAYQAYKDAQSATANKKTAYDNAKKSYDAAEKQNYNRIDKIVKAIGELSTLVTSISTSNIATYCDDIIGLQADLNDKETLLSLWPGHYMACVDGKFPIETAASRYASHMSLYRKLMDPDALVYLYNGSSIVRIITGKYPLSENGNCRFESQNYIPCKISKVKSLLESGKSISVTAWSSEREGDKCGLGPYSGDFYLSCKEGYAFPTVPVFDDLIKYYARIVYYEDMLTGYYTIFDRQSIYTSFNGISSWDALYDEMVSKRSSLSETKKELNNALNVQKSAQTNYDSKNKEITNLTSQINAYTTGTSATSQTTLKKAVDDAKAEYDAAYEYEQTTRNALDEILAGLYNPGANEYLNVALTGDVVANVSLGNYSGVINGNGHTITVTSSDGGVFNGFKGELKNVAVNGNLTTTADASLSNVAYWDGNSGAIMMRTARRQPSPISAHSDTRPARTSVSTMSPTDSQALQTIPDQEYTA